MIIILSPIFDIFPTNLSSANLSFFVSSMYSSLSGLLYNVCGVYVAGILHVSVCITYAAMEPESFQQQEKKK